MRDIREGFYSNTGNTIDPMVKKKWDAIRSGNIWNSKLYKGRKNTFLCINNDGVHVIQKLEDVYNENAMELKDIIIDAYGTVIFIRKDYEEIEVEPLFKLKMDQKFVPAMKELEKYL